ncbi:MAG TPA: DUF1287 domain-containing protein [Pyrinomonadaceae bacterium]|nr:DUF1287 domain-containing protein [Pyrinomonadaceae bacterium]
MRNCNGTLLTLLLTLMMIVAGVGFFGLASWRHSQQSQQLVINRGPAVPQSPTTKPLPDNAFPQLKQMLEGAIAQAGVTTSYDPAYVALEYPGGDVPENTGVCSDVVVRAFRKAGVDLQKSVHEDIKAARSAYPTKWGANAPDKNIDHRRVLNLMTYFTRQGKSLSITGNAADYQPGDVVSWELSSGIDHIGIVTNMLSESPDRYLIVHNIGAGTRIEDVMFAWTIKGHYRVF